MSAEQPDLFESDVEEFVLNLDTLEREASRPKPFGFMHLGRRWVLADPEDLDIFEIGYSERPIDTLRAALGEEQWPDFIEKPLPSWKCERLVDDYMKHYDLGKSEKRSK